eukprot:TRINITY_DN25516_c0_g1_i1.p1 TRINITY_DN25516_c0_g1~~TRINITY_DN25516_c0_g1_i1.p1  ORF type:complete len:343 (+),score=53.40 TRINITY_DN25516_c0_g1_i1:22-1029(+)
MGVRGDVLRHKKWNVWNPDNMDRVKRDVEQESSERDAMRTHKLRVAAEKRYEHMKTRARSGADSSTTAESSVAVSERKAPEPVAIRARDVHAVQLASRHEMKPVYVQELLRANKLLAHHDEEQRSIADQQIARVAAAMAGEGDVLGLEAGAAAAGQEPKKFREVWADKTRGDTYVKLVDTPDLAHAVNRGKKEAIPWWQRGTRADYECKGKDTIVAVPKQTVKEKQTGGGRASGSTVADPIGTMNEFLQSKAACERRTMVEIRQKSSEKEKQSKKKAKKKHKRSSSSSSSSSASSRSQKKKKRKADEWERLRKERDAREASEKTKAEHLTVKPRG